MSTTTWAEPKRRYQILELIGKGGAGRVYRALLQGPEGFRREVAIKLLRTDSATPLSLARLRDEARLLGLVRDRAVVVVDPPTRLDGRWAMVMEFVDGASAQRLLANGPLPPRVALEIVQEIARVLVKIYDLPGPDGPLHLIHRDLKPSNIQITPEGDVKLLDFGIARATFDAREAETQQYFSGTPGYIAPERLQGVEGPAGDVYSLGVMLHQLVRGGRATDLLPQEDDATERDPVHEPDPVIRLSMRMRAKDPGQRPTAGQVEWECEALWNVLDGPTLRPWARETVPRASGLDADEIVGTTLSETAGFPSEAPEVPPMESEPSARQRVLRMAVFGIMLAMGALLVAWWSATPTDRPAPAHQTPAPVVADAIQPASAPAPAPPAPAAPQTEPRPRRPVPIQVVTLPAPPAPTPAPVPAEPAPAPAPEIATVVVSATFDSVPAGATVFLDDVRIGRTPLRDHPLTARSYRLRFERDGGGSIERTVRIGGRNGKTTFTWEGDQLLGR